MTELTTLSKKEWKEKEILIIYYEDGYLFSSYMTVVDIDLQNSAFICSMLFIIR